MKEIEIFGPLDQDTNKILLVKARGNKPYDQVVYFMQVGNNIDLRIKYDFGKEFCELVYKTKKGISRNIRTELSVKLPKSNIKHLSKILTKLGITIGNYSKVKRLDFKYKYIIWSIKYGGNIGDYWEAEASEAVIKKLGYKKSLQYLIQIAQKLGLKVWSPVEFKKVRDNAQKEKTYVAVSKLSTLLK